MGKYNIRKATGRSQILEQDKLLPDKENTLVSLVKSDVLSEESNNLVKAKLEMFDNVVTHNYLSKLSS